jgi:N-acyl-D-aspartate/D-glutamate deacylase
MAWDLLLTGGLVFDGHGTPARREDIAIADGRVAARGIDLPRDNADRTIDVSGRWVMPGMLDIHTHVDLEVEVDPSLSEVTRHGTTTTVMSNCSLGLAFGAQLRNGENPIVDCFARVENIPKSVLQKVVDKVDWHDQAGYLDHLRSLPLGANVVPMIPHSMLRCEVMGLQGSVSRDPSTTELSRMEELVDEGMRLGYAGFSTDALPFHYLANHPNRRKKIPTQWSTRSELKRLLGVVRRYDRVWQATPPKDSPADTLRTMLFTSGRLYGKRLKTTAVAALDVHSDRSLLPLARFMNWLLNTDLVDGDFRLQALQGPFKVWGDGPVTPQFEEIEVLRELNEPDLDEVAVRRAIIDDPHWQERFRTMWMHGKDGKGLAGLRRRLRLEDYTITRDLDDMIVDGTTPVAAWDGRSFGDIHRAAVRHQRREPTARDDEERAAFDRMPPLRDEADFVIHLFREYDLDLRWWMVAANRDDRNMRRALFDDHMLPGFNDSGAHLTNMAFYDANLRGLKYAAQEGPATLSRHVSRLTKQPAEFFGLDVGTLDPGRPADIAVVDPDVLMAWDHEDTTVLVHRDAYEHHQMVNRPDGVVTLVVVGGTVMWEDGSPTADVGKTAAGRVLTADGPPAP